MMKKIIFIGMMCSQCCFLYAQQQGTIVYERKINLHRRLTDEQMKAMMPEFRTTKHVLLYSDSVSIYKTVKEEESPDPFDNNSGGGHRMMIQIGPGENGVLYRNFVNKQIKEQTEFADKNYIIDDTIKTQQWKLADETKLIMGHTCKRAMMKTASGNDVTAWYAEDITAPAGPENFGGLPGVILGVDVNNAEIVFKALEIKQGADKKELMEPKAGKHISRADLQNKMEEMLGPGERRVIRM